MFTAGMENYRKSLTNTLGEFVEGVPISTSIEKMVGDYPDIPELKENIIARELHNIGEGLRQSPKVYDRYIKDLTQVQYLIIESYRQDLEPTLTELPIPEIIKKSTLQEIPKENPISFQKLFDEFLADKQPALKLKQYQNYLAGFPVFYISLAINPSIK